MKIAVPGMKTLWIIGGLSLMLLAALVYLGREADLRGRNRVDLMVNETIALDLALNLEVLKLSQGRSLNYDGLVAIDRAIDGNLRELKSEFARLGLNYTVQGVTNLIGFHAQGNYSTAVGESATASASLRLEMRPSRCNTARMRKSMRSNSSGGAIMSVISRYSQNFSLLTSHIMEKNSPDKAAHCGYSLSLSCPRPP